MSRPTEIRTYHDMAQQIELERMLAARKAREAARAAKFANTKADEANDARWELIFAIVITATATPLVAALASWLLPIAWGAK